MDDAVVRALAKWPNVPACYGWLALDRRGRWRMRDEYAQAHGLLGDVVRNATLKGFIDRNYACDAQGAWYFQNGPQRVYVNLEAAPFVFMLEGAPLHIARHDGRAVEAVRRALVDENGNFWLETDTGFGLVCDRDLARLLEHVRALHGARDEEGIDGLLESPEHFALHVPQSRSPLHLERLRFCDAPTLYGYLLRPAPGRDAPPIL